MSDKDLIYLPSSHGSISAPHHKEENLRLPTGLHVDVKPYNFERALQRLKETGQLSMDDFKNGKELGAFIDWYNHLNKNLSAKIYEQMISDITNEIVTYKHAIPELEVENELKKQKSYIDRRRKEMGYKPPEKKILLK